LKNSESLKQREVALQNLEQGYNSFKGLCDNFTEGIKVNFEIVSQRKDCSSLVLS
jgi:hypothetical protein